MKPILIAVSAMSLSLTMVAGAAAREPGVPRSQATFKRLDSNHNGALEAGELRTASLKRFMSLDADGDGAVSVAEIDAWLLRAARKRRDGMLKRMDGDGDGRITAAEAEAYARALFARADGDGDGRLTRAESRAYHIKRRRSYRQARQQGAGSD